MESRPPGHGGLINQLGEWGVFGNMRMMVFGCSKESGVEQTETAVRKHGPRQGSTEDRQVGARPEQP